MSYFFDIILTKIKMCKRMTVKQTNIKFYPNGWSCSGAVKTKQSHTAQLTEVFLQVYVEKFSELTSINWILSPEV
jgi:hypothetical protein